MHRLTHSAAPTDHDSTNSPEQQYQQPGTRVPTHAICHLEHECQSRRLNRLPQNARTVVSAVSRARAGTHTNAVRTVPPTQAPAHWQHGLVAPGRAAPEFPVVAVSHPLWGCKPA